MKTKKMIGMAVAAVVLGTAAYMIKSSKQVRTPSSLGKPVLPALDLSKIQKIELKSGAETFRVESSDSGWKLSTLYDYPADITKIRGHLLKLKDLKIGQNATADKVENADLLDLQDETGKSIASLRLGAVHTRAATGQMAQFGGGSFPDGRYVSPAGDKRAYLVKEPLTSLTSDPSNWADNKIIDITASDVNGIALMKGADACILSKKDGSWTIAGLKENEEFDSSASYSLESALNSLTFSNLADPSMGDDQSGIATGSVYKVTLNNGESYTAAMGSTAAGSADRYMKISATFTPQGTNETVNATARTKVEEFNKNTSNWIYIIPSYKAESMMKTRSDLVKEKEKEADKEEKKEAEPQKESV